MSPLFAELPLYLLIDDKTFSAAESFSFGMQRTSRAVLVGVRTAGGGHMNMPFDLAGGFGASISVGRTFDPQTGEGWQSTGVVPGASSFSQVPITMHYETHQPVLDDLEARITTIRDSL